MDGPKHIIYWESRLVAAASQLVTKSSSPDWLKSKEFDQFLMSWTDLQSCYEKNQDDRISAEVMSQFILIARALIRIDWQPEIDVPTKHLATYRLMELLTAADQTIGAAYNNHFHNQGGDPNEL